MKLYPLAFLFLTTVSAAAMAQTTAPAATPQAPAAYQPVENPQIPAQVPAAKPAAPAATATTVQTTSSTPPAKDPKFDTSLPIEITSDTLEVLQHENKAVFKGNVVAVQGEVRLKSDVMTVHYKNKGGDTPEPTQPAATPAKADKAPAGDMGAITFIEVEGNVFMATPEESAKGDKGDYDVATRMLHLTGGNVVLTRDKNIMRGTALEYNMETGHSILTNGTNEVPGNPNGGRVHSVFVPNKAPQTTTPPAKPPAPTATPNH